MGWVCRLQKITTIITQEQMNNLFVGPVFELETRYTEVCEPKAVEFCVSVGLRMMRLVTDIGHPPRHDDVWYRHSHFVLVCGRWVSCPLLDGKGSCFVWAVWKASVAHGSLSDV
jgi:hypothetical protein